jgi:hypothetical protein
MSLNGVPRPDDHGRSAFPPIADYAFLSDCEATALVAPSGAVEWMCLPRLDSPSVFGAVLDRVVGIDKPPPASFNLTATTLGSLTALANRNFFTREVRNRVAIVFTDAESRPFASASIGRVFRRPPGIRVVFVRYGNADERVFTLDGGTESGYRPDPDAPAIARSLAQAAGGDVFDEGSTGDVADTVRRALGHGETKVDDDDRRDIPLAPYSVALAFLPLGLLVWRRNL